MITIPLTQGLVAVIDDEDAHLAKFKWYANRDPDGPIYARRWDGVKNGRQVSKRLHREVLGLSDPKTLVDHIDGNGLNCRRSNLRIVSAVENARNLGGPRKNNRTSPFLGVTARHGKFRARIRHEGRLVQIGTFETAEEANAARLKFEAEVWGDIRKARWAR